MKHLHYYQVKAQTHFELGSKLAQLFKAPSLQLYSSILDKIPSQKEAHIWAQKHLQPTEEQFPQYIEELRGYASGLGVDFGSFWLTFLTEELNIYPEKCTSCYSHDGLIIGHNEDFLPYFENTISLVEKTLGNMNVFEIYYYNSLGGSACSINSNGYVQTINTLHHADQQIGVPRNVIARWLSETIDPKNDFKKLLNIKRSMGYSHTLCDLKGEIVNIESTAHESCFVHVTPPYIHTNHYLSDLSKYEDRATLKNTIDRYTVATSQIGTVKTAQNMMKLLEDVSHLHPNDTIARIVVDLKNKSAWCWLARERAKGWIEYPLNFI
jgi:hypothetical protein